MSSEDSKEFAWSQEVETRLTRVESAITSIKSSMDELTATLRAMQSQQRTNWPVLLSLAGVLMSFFVVIFAPYALQLRATQEDLKPLPAYVQHMGNNTNRLDRMDVNLQREMRDLDGRLQAEFSSRLEELEKFEDSMEARFFEHALSYGHPAVEAEVQHMKNEFDEFKKEQLKMMGNRFTKDDWHRERAKLLQHIGDSK